MRKADLTNAQAFVRRAWDVCVSRKEQPTVFDFRRALREIGAPFGSERPFEVHYGVTWSELREALQRGQWPPTKQNERRPTFEAIGPNAHTLVPAGEASPAECWKALVSASKTRAVAADEMRHRDVQIATKGPIGVIVMGDMHVGSVGVDYDRLEWILSLLEGQDALFAVSIGDILDSMIWRTVMHEGRKSPVDFPGEIRAAADFLGRLYKTGRFIGVCAGNHDLISGKLTGLSALDGVMESVCKNVPYHPYQLDLNITLNNEVDYHMRLRHKVTGNSSWNAAHGVGKAHRFDDGDADIICAGHTHRSGVTEMLHKGRMRYGIQVGAYKVSALDDYALENGFANENLHPDYMVLLWPNKRRIETMPTKTGCEYLTSKLSPTTRCTTPSNRGRETGTASASTTSSSATGSRSRRAASRRSR